MYMLWNGFCMIWEIHLQSGFFAVSRVSAIRDGSEVKRQVWTKQPVFYAILAVSLWMLTALAYLNGTTAINPFINWLSMPLIKFICFCAKCMIQGNWIRPIETLCQFERQVVMKAPRYETDFHKKPLWCSPTLGNSELIIPNFSHVCRLKMFPPCFNT